MNCDRYKNALPEAAANNEKLDAQLAHHIAHCPKCRARLRSERDLFSQIDVTLRTRVNEDLRPGFLARVRVQLSKELPAPDESNVAWRMAGTALALLLIAMFYPWVNVRKPSVEGNPHTASVEGPQTSAKTRAVLESGHDLGGQRRRSSSNKIVAQAPSPQQPEVLVPRDEQQAFAQFVARVQGRDVMAEAVVHPAPVKTAVGNTEVPEVHSVDIAGLQLEKERDEWMNEAAGSE